MAPAVSWIVLGLCFGLQPVEHISFELKLVTFALFNALQLVMLCLCYTRAGNSEPVAQWLLHRELPFCAAALVASRLSTSPPKMDLTAPGAGKAAKMGGAPRTHSR